MKILKAIILITFLSFIASDQIEINDKILENFSDKSPKELFKVWHSIFEKTYDFTTEEAYLRFKNFEENLAFIKEHNSKGDSLILGLNEFSDMSHEEFKQIYLDPTIGDKFKQAIELKEKFQLSAEPEIFSSIKKDSNGFYPAIDWRSHLLTPRNQGSCGSCWAFANNGAVEGNRSIKFPTSTRVYLSTQQLLDCDKKDNACNGGDPTHSLDYTIAKGLTDDKSYPYKAAKGTCNLAKTKNLCPEFLILKFVLENIA